MRNIVDDPERWARYVAAIDKQLDQGNAGPFQIAFEHGYGRPPQALDVRTATVQPGEQVIYAAAFADGDPLGEAPEAAAAEAVPEGSGQ